MSEKVFKYCILGSPEALLRDKFIRGPNAIHNPQTTRKLIASIALQNQHGDRPPFRGPIEIQIIFYMPIPKTTPTRNRSNIKAGQPHCIKPRINDCSNFYLQVASHSNILFADSCIITNFSAKKVYDANPRTELIIKEIK